MGGRRTGRALRRAERQGPRPSGRSPRLRHPPRDNRKYIYHGKVFQIFNSSTATEREAHDMDLITAKVND